MMLHVFMDLFAYAQTALNLCAAFEEMFMLLCIYEMRFEFRNGIL